MVGVTARSAAQTTLEATFGNINTPSVWIDPTNGQSYYVVTMLRRASGERPRRAGARCRCASTDGARGDAGRLRRRWSARLGPIAIERNQLQRAAHVLMQTEGRDIGSAADELEAKLKADPRTREPRLPLRGPGRPDAHDLRRASAWRSAWR